MTRESPTTHSGTTKVYVATYQIDYEDSYMVGVFSTPDKAWAAIGRKGFNSGTPCVDEYVVDES